ncbi:hypothetical protein PMLGA01_130010800 [Plasmodium malariae]|uniref:Uncharacterized protein n=1 Tax=Plasmodium malariae TaxID=5858 RepID=A0A1C3KEJ2_PLAMA|nr:hypothetical protein PMLGA01_130010800 [Plasmodium malariae]
MNITHFINCIIEAINILFVNQSHNQITVEWLSFVIRFSICFIHWMKNHDENLINLVPLTKKQFELKKRNLLFYSLFSSYSEVYALYLDIDKNNKFTGCKKKFVKAENLEEFYNYLEESTILPKKGEDYYKKSDYDISEDCTYSNFLDDVFYRCEHDIIKMLFDEQIFKNLSISLIEFYFAIYMIQFIESKRLSILLFLFCEKKSYLNKEKQFLKIIEARKKDIQNITCSYNSTKVYEFVEYNFLMEYNDVLKNKIKKLQNLIKKKEQILVKKEKMKSMTLPQGDNINRISNINTYFVQTLKKLLEESPPCSNNIQNKSISDKREHSE